MSEDTVIIHVLDTQENDVPGFRVSVNYNQYHSQNLFIPLNTIRSFPGAPTPIDNTLDLVGITAFIYRQGGIGQELIDIAIDEDTPIDATDAIVMPSAVILRLRGWDEELAARALEDRTLPATNSPPPRRRF